MTSAITNPVEEPWIPGARQGAGLVNAVRFLREYETGGGDYVRERDAILPDWDADTLVKKALRTQ